MMVCKNMLAVVLAWTLALPVWGQEGRVDSLEEALAESKNLSEAILAKIGLAEYYIYHNLDSADYYVSDIFSTPNLENHLPEKYSFHLLLKAWVHQGRGELDIARKHMEQVENIRKTTNNREDLLEIQFNLASVLVEMGAPEAMEYVDHCQFALDTTLKSDQEAWLFHQYFKGRISGDREEYATAIEELLLLLRTPFLNLAQGMKEGVLNTLGIYLSKLGNKQLAISYGKQALKSKKILALERPAILINIASWYLDLGELDSCQHYLSKVENINRLEEVDCRSYYYCQAGIANVKGDYKATITALEKGRQCMKEGLQNPKFIFLFNLAEGEAWYKLGDLDRASTFLANSRATLEAYDQLQIIQYQTGLAKLDLQIRLMESMPESVPLYEKYDRLRVKELDIASEKKLKEALVKYQTEQKELQNQALQRENELQASINRNQRMGLGGLGLGLVTLAGLSLFLYRQRQRIQAQKSEIELLHREQRHRMMNNLVFANSLMSLQVNRLKEQPEAQQAVKEADARLRAMSVLQSRLHHDGEGQKTVAIHEYLEEVTNALQHSFGSPDKPLNIHLHAPDAEQVDGEAAMRIGLIVNELATNSCKHAFAEQPDPQIDVHLEPQSDNRYRLIYTDNGSGLPADFQVDTKQSMGLFLIHNLVKQLNGRIAFSGEEGTRVECEFDLTAA
jgi:two-component sensor histidine kinase